MREPGKLDALGPDGGAAWRAKVERIAAEAIRDLPDTQLSLADDLSHVSMTDWHGLPSRVVACAGRSSALGLLDRRGRHGDEGRRRLQEEYLEWRTVRDEAGAIVRVELTTELGAYWRTLAAHEPAALLDTVTEFAREDRVPPEAVFGVADPSALPPDERETAFARTMLDAGGARSPYNSGSRAICCMVHESNTLSALLKLAAAASCPLTIAEAGATPRAAFTAGDVIAAMGRGAIAGRASDPVLVERLTRLTWDGRKIGVDDPIGVYLTGAEHHRLRTPSGEPVPSDWWRFSRGLPAARSPDGRPRHQRLVLEAPRDEGCVVGDLVDAATEQPIQHGGQIAELVQVAVYLRVGDERAVEPRPRHAGDVRPAATDCDEVSAAQRETESKR